MPNHLKEAFRSLSYQRGDEGGKLCDKVAEALTGMASGALARLNSDLDFGWLTMQGLRSTDAGLRQIAIDRRRAATLVAKARRMDRATVQLAESWNEENHRRVFEAALQAPGTPVRGFFLKGSFWAFSSEADRDWTRQSWSDALQLVRAGMDVTRAASVPGSPAEIIVSRYFGNAVAGAVFVKLNRLNNAMAFNTCGITYMGDGLAGNERYKEFSRNNYLEILYYAGNTGEWGWAAIENVRSHTIGFNPVFFDKTKAQMLRSVLHDVTSPLSNISRGGAIVHELTHRYLQTKDVEVPMAALTQLGKGSQHGIKAYGPLACCAVAKFTPALAVTNADTYRVFCEDAWASQHGGTVTATPLLPGELRQMP